MAFLAKPTRATCPRAAWLAGARRELGARGRALLGSGTFFLPSGRPPWHTVASVRTALGGMRVSHGGTHQPERGGSRGPRTGIPRECRACMHFPRTFVCARLCCVIRVSHARSCRRGLADSSTHLGRANGRAPRPGRRPGTAAAHSAHRTSRIPLTDYGLTRRRHSSVGSPQTPKRPAWATTRGRSAIMADLLRIISYSYIQLCQTK